jgi:hypothetical protein
MKRPVSGEMASRFLSALAAAAVALLPSVPAEHVHQTGEPGHAHLIVHRHSDPHGLVEHVVRRTPAVDDDDDDAPVLTLAPVFAAPESTVDAVVALIPVGNVVAAPTPRVARWLAVDVERLIHGPPRAPALLRGPPIVPATSRG